MRRKILLLILVPLFLLGCTSTSVPTKLGISDLEWTSYSKDKQATLITNYYQIAEEHKNTVKKQESKKINNENFLLVKIYNGHIMLPPLFINWHNYKPAQFTIFHGQCRDIVLEGSGNNSKTLLRSCFHDNTLYLDPSRYDLTKKNGTVSIKSSPLWVSGFVYKGINSSGYVRLSDVTVEIKQLEQRAEIVEKSEKDEKNNKEDKVERSEKIKQEKLS